MLLLLTKRSFVSIDVLLTWGANRFAAIPVRYSPRLIGKSQYTFRKLVRHALNMMTGFSIRPLQLATLAGFAFTFFGVVVLAFVIGRYLIHGVDVPGVHIPCTSIRHHLFGSSIVCVGYYRRVFGPGPFFV